MRSLEDHNASVIANRDLDPDDVDLGLVDEAEAYDLEASVAEAAAEKEASAYWEDLAAELEALEAQEPAIAELLELPRAVDQVDQESEAE